MSKITNVHDKFIKEILSEKENVIDYIEEVVPKNIKENLDYSTLTIEMKNEKRK